MLMTILINRFIINRFIYFINIIVCSYFFICSNSFILYTTNLILSVINTINYIILQKPNYSHSSSLFNNKNVFKANFGIFFDKKKNSRFPYIILVCQLFPQHILYLLPLPLSHESFSRTDQTFDQNMDT